MNQDIPNGSISAGERIDVTQLSARRRGFEVRSGELALGRFEAAMRRHRRPALALALVTTVVLVVAVGALGDSAHIRDGGVPALSALQGLAGWSWLVAIMGFGGSLMERRARSGAEGPDVTRAGSETRSQRIARYVNEAVLPFYVLHEPVIVAAAWVIVRWDAPLVAKYVALVVVSFAVTLGLYELLIRRCRIPRLLFGMKQVRA